MASKSSSILTLHVTLLAACSLVCVSSHASAQQARPTRASASKPSAPGAKRPARHKEYDEVLRESNLVILGEILDAQILQLRNQPGPLPEPVQTVDEEGYRSKVSLAAASWFFPELFDPPRLWSYRAEVRIREPFSGPLRKDHRISVNLVYGVSKDFVSEFITRPYAKDLCAKGSLVVLHLRKTRKETVALGHAEYELEPEQAPWPVSKDGLRQTITDMRIRMRRYEALQEIDKLVARVENLSDTERKTLRELVTASRPGLGQPRWAPRERTYLDQVLAGSVPGQAPAQAWRSWWSANRGSFINAPFRIGAGLGSQPSSETRPG
jgi:hypothetical protein